ncbi:MAG: hypothetical protein PVH68_02855 [Armatimonadota bacterium]|jgi:hypothetical protein
MLKINLLPEHFALVRRTKQLIALFIVLAVAVLAGFLGYDQAVMRPRMTAEQNRIAEFTPKAAEVDELESAARATAGQIPAFQRPVQFVRDLETLPERYVEAFQNVNEYFFANARMLTFAVNGNQVSFTAEVNSATDVGRFYLNILRCPYITSIGFNAWGGGTGGGGGGGFGGGFGGEGEEGEEEDEGDDAPTIGGFGGGGRAGGGGAVVTGRIPIQVSATLVRGIPQPVPGAGATASPRPGTPAAGPGAPPAGAAGDTTGAMPSAAAPGGGVVMPEEM